MSEWEELIRNKEFDKWKPVHTAFINAQFEKSREFYENMIKCGEKEKIIKLFGIKNKKAIPKLFE
ncbi:MAG: hypothetical protein PHW96_03855 [Candidatus Nanoarchaeia archaeon]|nr:hypothetical protein [Candidatus Nanoarchaeia archaeon]